MRLLGQDLEERPWATHSQRAEFLLAVSGVSVSEATVCRAIRRLNSSRKKIQRGTRTRRVLEITLAHGGRLRRPYRLVFVDEMEPHTSLAPIYGYSPIGERAFFEIPRNRGKSTTLLTSIHRGGMGPSLAVEGATTSRVFETYVERLLAPTLKPGQVVVMDNLGAHRPKRIRELIEERGCDLLYLPPYSPDFNPIEEALSKIKHFLRRASARTKEGLIEAMGQALASVSAEDVQGFFTHCGYRAPAQQL